MIKLLGGEKFIYWCEISVYKFVYKFFLESSNKTKPIFLIKLDKVTFF